MNPTPDRSASPALECSSTTPSGIMLIDDCETDRYLTKEILDRSGFSGEFFEAEHGRDALERLEARLEKLKETSAPSSSLSLILLIDLKMPIMNGMEFIDSVAVHPQFQQFPRFALITPGVDLSTIKWGQERPHALLEKPLNVGLLLDALYATSNLRWSVSGTP